jgi:hypothetical protein
VVQVVAVFGFARQAYQVAMVALLCVSGFVDGDRSAARSSAYDAGDGPLRSFSKEKTMAIKINRKAANVPTEEQALKRLEQHIEVGDLDEIIAPWLPTRLRYLVTYMNSQTAGRMRSATVVSVTNQSTRPNLVTVSWFKGFSANSSPVGVTSFMIPPDFTVDFGSRDLPGELTTLNSVCNPQLVFDEGRAIVSSRQPEIGVSARVYYTSGDGDEELHAITDSKLVEFGEGNDGD